MSGIDEAPTTCPYCGSPVKLVDNSMIYGRSVGRWPYVYLCLNDRCAAYVGTHPNTNRALGTLADEETREARVLAHEAFDPLWRGKDKLMGRREAYLWLALQLGGSPAETHIGWSDASTCREIARLATAKVEELRKERGHTMPYDVRKGPPCPNSKPFGIYKKGTGEKVGGCHPSADQAYKQVAAINHRERGKK